MIEISLLILFVIALVVSIHFESLHFISGLLVKLSIAKRPRIVVGVVATLAVHIFEVVVFGCVYYILIKGVDLGALVAVDTTIDGSLLDCTYFSFSMYTSLGPGDIIPVGPLRFLAGVESLVGLVMIGWTASFLYVEMTKFWETD